MTDQSTPTINNRIQEFEKVVINYRVKSDMAYSELQDGFYSNKDYREALEFEMGQVRTQLIFLLTDFAKRITPEKKDRWSAQGTMKAELDAWNRCVDTITQNVKAELGAAPKELK